METQRITEQEAERRLAALRPEMLRRAGSRLPRQDAEDAVQEAQYRVWEMAPCVYDAATGEEGFYRWSVTVLANVIHEFTRRRRAASARSCQLWEAADDEDDQDDCAAAASYRIEDDVLDAIEREEARAALAEVMGRAGLSERQEEVVRLILTDETTREIAARMGISVKNVHAHLSAAREKMVAARGVQEEIR
jgi:RNA polymerase sigma factor, sigma-70 family